MLVEILKWAASISGMVAALMVASDLGRRMTGWGFVLFAASSVAWIAGGLLDEEGALATQNVVLFAINLLGVWRYLVRKQAVSQGSETGFAQQTIVNEKDEPIYISIEPYPDCYELEPGEKLTFGFELPEGGDALDVRFVDHRELVIWPAGEVPEPTVLIDGVSAKGRSWKFKHAR